MSQRSEFRLGYRPELDGVRGISILLVLCLHFKPSLMPGGYFGVDIFFVLSGFLITSLLLQERLRENSISLKSFYIRRVLRLGPALVFYLLMLAVYASLFLRRESAYEIYTGILLTLSYVSNWVIAFWPDFPVSIVGITWSLAIEEQFYLVWPLLLAVSLRLKVKPRWVLIALVFAIVGVTLQRRILWETGASIKRLYYATDTHADGLLLGCLLGCLLSWNLLPKSKALLVSLTVLAPLAVLFILFLALTTKRDTGFLYEGGFSLVSLAIALVLLVLVLRPPPLALTVLRFGPLTWVGRISYGLYLWHWPVRGVVFGQAQHPANSQIIIGVILAFVIASFSYYLIEKPFLALKQRFSKRRHGFEAVCHPSAARIAIKGIIGSP